MRLSYLKHVVLAISLFSTDLSSAYSEIFVDATNKNAFIGGELNAAQAEKLSDAIKSKKFNKLYVDSLGGSSEAAIDLGKLIQEFKISVIVLNRCYSACANYLFLPSMHRSKLSIAKIGLHGGYQSFLKEAESHDISQLDKSYLASFNALNSHLKKYALIEKEMLRRSEINPEIISYSAQKTKQSGLSVGNGTSYFKFAEKNKYESDYWFPSADQYQKWGVVVNELDFNDIPKSILVFLGNDAATISRKP
jgi:ATP-dependent protease ClpP protease subunit